jgi:peptidoglycan/LPS O-acetylase OafA/YrhL
MGWYASPAMFETHVRYDQCAAGVALAWVCVERPGWWRALTRAAPWLAAGGLGLVAYLVGVGGLPVPLPLYPTVDITAWTLVFTSWLLLAVTSAWWAGLRLPGAEYLANRAFALYLLHVEAIAAVRRLGELPLAVQFVLVWGIALAGAEVLYRVVERPGMRVREWFALTRSRPREPLTGTGRT